MTDAHFDPLTHVAQPDHPSAIEQARARAGRAIRDIGHALVGHHAPVELLDELSGTLDGLTRALETGEQRSRSQVRRDGELDAPPDGAVMTTYDERPVSGRGSPWGLDLEVRRDGHEAVATLTLRAAHEGAPDRSHGGIVAALFDDVYGFLLAISEQSGFTGELWVRYQAGVPIGEPLACRVRIDREDGRKLHMSGELTVAGSDDVLVRSSAVFITVDPALWNRD